MSRFKVQQRFAQLGNNLPGYALSPSHDNSLSGLPFVDCESDAGLAFRGGIGDVETTGGKFTGPISFNTADVSRR